MSEDAAFRRSKAARLVREHPEVRDLITRGELHLTGLLMIGPYLGGDRHEEILQRVRFRSKTDCRETRGLELHHRRAHALGGPPTVHNLEVRCKAHNTLAAEADFGREHMDRARGAKHAGGLVEKV